MGNEYKKIVLLKGLEVINDYHFRTIKSLLTDDLKLTGKMQDEYDRIKIADLLADKFQSDAGLSTLIKLFKDIDPLKNLAEKLQTEKLKLLKKNKPKAAKGATPLKKTNQDETGLATPEPTRGNTITTTTAEETPEAQKRKKATKENSGTKRSKVCDVQTPSPCLERANMSTTMGQISASTPCKTPSTEKRQPQHQVAARGNYVHKDPKTVMVLKAMAPFEYEISEEKKGTMFHATVASETELFQVKVFDTNLKEKFTKNKVIIISDYFKYKGILEIYDTSSVSEASPDQQIEVPRSIISKATKSFKIDQLQKQASGTIVYGSFKLQKKTVKLKNTIYEIQDNTGKMDVVGNGKWHNIKCEEGDKLQLFCFHLKTIDKNLKLTCGIHSFIKVTKGTKCKKTPMDFNLSQKVEEMTHPPNQPNVFGSDIVKVEPFF